MSDSYDTEVAVVGGGPAGAAIAAHLMRAGREVVVFERHAKPGWRACGVYSSPLTRRRLSQLGLDTGQLDTYIRPIATMVVETDDGSAACRLDYTTAPACGIDRVGLDAALVDLIRGLGVRVFEGAVARSVEFTQEGPRILVSHVDGAATWRARVVVGADGPTSIVARSAGAVAGGGMFRRAALTGHRAATRSEAHMIIGSGWYLGLAPVPGERVNLGLVMSEARLRRELGTRRPPEVLSAAARRSLSGADLADAAATDDVATQVPLVHRVRRAAGQGFALVGDAAGFVDPLSGEGLQRALASAQLAAVAVDRHLAGDQSALRDYDRHLRARFRSKDVLSWLLQLFVFQPRLARHALRRLDQRPELRRAFASALADLAPATTVIDPRFVARLLA